MLCILLTIYKTGGSESVLLYRHQQGGRKMKETRVTQNQTRVQRNYKNDISFVFDFELLLYEHQSTCNPNMPLRDLFYITRVLQNRTENKNLYSKTLIKIPTPRFVVFYNRMDFQPEQQLLYLSNACRLLKEYAQYVAQVRIERRRLR